MDGTVIEPNKKRLKLSSLISERLKSAEFQELFSKNWHSSKSLRTDDIEIIAEPFRICKISNFLSSDEFIDGIKSELTEVETRRNDIDLYQFEQTEDLANVDSGGIKKLRKAFKNDLANWMERNLKIELNDKMSMSSAVYSDTDYLLCHDDNIGDRRIAFILYLSKDWTEEDGGALDIFDTDENGLPKDVVRSLVPEYNSLVFFEVVENSYHQVAEVTSLDRSRVTINGWFHGPLPGESKKRSRPETIHKYFEPVHNEVDLVSWVSKTYLIQDIVKEIQQTVEQDSFIYLPNYLRSERFARISDEVKSEDVRWRRVGPADLQNYEVADEESLPDGLKEFYDMFKSIHIFHLLKQYTELDLVPEEEGMKPKLKIELQRWSQGCYTLISDKSMDDYTKKTDGNVVGNERRVSEKKNGMEDVRDDTEEDIRDEEAEGSTAEKCIRDLEKRIKEKQKQIESHRNDEKSKSKGKKDKEKKNDHLESPRKNSNASEEADRKSTKGKSPKGKSKMSFAQTASPSKSRKSPQKPAKHMDSDDSEVSDIDDYLSDSQNDSEIESSDHEHESADNGSGILDVLLQFHTVNATEDSTIDYVEPSQKDGALIHVPPQDNHLCLVYRTVGTSRCNKYVNHYCKGYFYILVCSYYE